MVWNEFHCAYSKWTTSALLLTTMKKIALYLPLFLLLCSVVVNAQTTASTADMNNLRNVIAPSPNAAALGKYGEWPVNLNSGTPSINIPLYELKGRTLSVPIALTYHASGIKVGEKASWVGSGWSLQAGGVITRSVRGLPDECGIAGYFYNRRLFPDYNYTFENSAPTSQLWKQLVMTQANNETDGVHDSYFLNVMGRSYRLLFKDGPSGVEVQTIPYSNLKVTTQTSTLTSWTVLLEDGTRLEFGGTGYTEVTSNSRSGFASTCGPSFRSSWYLKSVTSPLNETIDFKYITTSNVAMNNYFSMDDCVGWNSEFGAYRGTISTNQEREDQTITMLQLDEITSETGLIKFNTRSDSTRKDLPGMRALASMEVKSNINGVITLVDRFDFTTYQQSSAPGNEYPSSGADDMHWRLMLKDVRHSGSAALSNVPQWKFEYNPTKLPSTLSYAQDHYGYYNGSTTNTGLLPRAWVTSPYPGSSNTDGFFPPLHELGSDREPNGTAMQAGILTKITYPTGGSSQFNYEPNSYTKVMENFVDETVSLNLLVSPTMNPVETSKTITIQTTKPQYIKLYFENTIAPSVLEDFPSVQCSAQVTGPNVPYNKTISLASSGVQYFDLPFAGTYSFTISTNAVPSSFFSTDYIDMHAELTYTKSLGTGPTTVLAGGLRVKSIVDSDGNDPSKDMARHFEYSSPLVLSAFESTNDYLTLRYERTDVNYLNTKYFRSGSTKFALGSGGATIVYGKVITKYGASAQNGYTQTVFLNNLDANLSGAPVNMAPYTDLDTREYERGLVSSELTFDASGNKIKGSFHTYEFLPITQLTFFKAIKSVFHYGAATCPDPEGFCDYLILNEGLTTRQVNKLSTREVTYMKNGSLYDSLYTLTNYMYQTPRNTQPTLITTTDSKGITRKTTRRTVLEFADIYSYLKDQNLSSSVMDSVVAFDALKSMRQNNMVSQVVQEKNESGSSLLGVSTTNYRKWSSPVFIAPMNIMAQSGNNAAEIRVFFTRYDKNGNLLEQHKAADVKHVYLYDYNKSYPIAEVTNADTASIAYTSFEAESTGKWVVNTSSRNTNNFYTGFKSLPMSTSVTLVRNGLSTGKNYIVSFWAKSGSTVRINGATPVAKDTRNGWTYYELTLTPDVSTAANPKITLSNISATAYVDEVRLYPEGAQMATYTYLPLIGIKSATDAASTTVFYEYDGLQRLVTIRTIAIRC